MPKGYKLPKSAKSKGTMRVRAPEKASLLSKAPSGLPSLPEVKPTYKRNQVPSPSGFKRGSY